MIYLIFRFQELEQLRPLGEHPASVGVPENHDARSFLPEGLLRAGRSESSCRGK